VVATGSTSRPPLVACVDFGSTFTKAALVDTGDGRLVAAAEHRTTIDTDVLDGWEACLEELAEVEPAARDAEVLACSSAGGGLRIAVVGYEELVTAEAGRRVALSSGGRVVHVAAGGLSRPAVKELRDSRPDVVLLVGGSDGGNSEVLLTAARTLAKARWRKPVVVAGNVDARAEVADLLTAAGTPHVLADNVVPRIGVLAPDSARAAIREMFLRHVIGGKHLSRGDVFTDMVRGATPDLVLTGVELLARGLDAERPGAGDVVVVDVGGATTDVHSVVELDAEDDGLSREVVATVPVSRTVEGDLGMRWSAVPTVAEACAAGLLAEGLHGAAVRRSADPGFVPEDEPERHADRAIGTAAVTLALRRHAGRAQVLFDDRGRVVERTGKDLREVDLVVGSGGVLRHGHQGEAVLTDALVPRGGGWQLPEHARVTVDRDYVLAPAGLLAERYPEAAYALLARLR
jgi:uncharacterized protein (TIGR01319 family)